MPGERRPAIGVIRPELLRGKQIDLTAIAGPDFRLVFTVFLDAGPMLTALAIVRHLDEFAAAAVTPRHPIARRPARPPLARTGGRSRRNPGNHSRSRRRARTIGL